MPTSAALQGKQLLPETWGWSIRQTRESTEALGETVLEAEAVLCLVLSTRRRVPCCLVFGHFRDLCLPRCLC